MSGSMIPDYTLVVGVDRYHLDQLALTWPALRRHKPSLLLHPMVVFYDRDQLTEDRVRKVVDHPFLRCFPWPHPSCEEYEYQEGDGKWASPQRYKMLAGFVYTAAFAVGGTPSFDIDSSNGSVHYTGIDGATEIAAKATLTSRGETLEQANDRVGRILLHMEQK